MSITKFSVEGGITAAEKTESVSMIEFERWFGNSKVVDDQGQPLVVYHGTNADIDKFDVDTIGKNFPGMSRAFYFSETPLGALLYALDPAGASMPRSSIPCIFKGAPAEVGTGGSNIMPVYLRAERPLRKTALGNFSPEQWLDKHREKLFKQVKEGGFDSIEIRPGRYFGDRGTVFAVLRPEQIKSAIGNNGLFSDADANICN